MVAHFTSRCHVECGSRMFADRPGLAAAGELAGDASTRDTSKLAVIIADPDPSPLAFAAVKLESALKNHGWEVRRNDDLPKRGLVVRLGAYRTEVAQELSRADVRAVPTLEAEGFAIRVSRRGPLVRVWVVGGDSAGTMYGGLELAEHIRAGADPAAAEEIEQRPRFSLRAVKVNLPWVSYRKHECLQLHEETCRDLTFWKALIDHLAECPSTA